VVIVDKENMELSRSIGIGGLENNHAIIRYSGIIYEPQNGYIYTGLVNYYYTFDEVFN